MIADSAGRRPRLLMAVYNEIDYDGRVQRAAAALADSFDVLVVSIDSGRGFTSGQYGVAPVRLPAGPAALRHLRFWWALWARAARLRPAVVYAHDLFLPFAGWVAARLCGARLVYDAHELMVPEPVRRMTPRERLFYWMERWVVGRADLVVAAGPERAEVMRRHYGLRDAPLVIQNIPPVEHPHLPPGELARRYPALAVRTPETVRVVYQGDVDLGRGLGAFVDAMAELESRFQLLLVGSGPHLAQLKERARRDGLAGRIVFLGRVPRADLPDIMAACDAGIVCYSTEGLNNVYCASNKVFEYAQAGLPVVSTCQPPLRGLVGGFTTGVLVGCNGAATSPAEVAAAIRTVAAERERFQRGIAEMLRSHTWDREAQRLRAALAALIRTESAA